MLFVYECLVRAGEHGVDKGLLFEEDEPVEGGEEDDGQEHVGEVACRGNQQLGQAPQINSHLPGPEVKFTIEQIGQSLLGTNSYLTKHS